ncbi:MAG: C4-type zinc ribbon domain-containing protein [Thermodesulfobacteriota bacterium]|nr:C4-type zinc ribbon domain-containing protein [Thermodesulfobacteriota bacterium]
MKEKMKALIHLQDCDTRIKSIQIKKEEDPIRIQRLEEDLDHLGKQLEEELNQLDAYKREGRQAEKDIEGIDDQTEKANTKLSSIRSNREYRAALKEIDDLHTEKSVLEDKILEIMEKIEMLESRCVAGKAQRRHLRDGFEKERDAVLKELEALDHDLEVLGKERARYCLAIDEGLLKRYDFLKKHKDGLAVSPVIKGVCQTCNMGIPPQKFNELIRGEELMNCPNCTRIIYWGEAEHFRDTVAETK